MHIILDARTATDHFPGIGRYVSNLARALALQLDTTEQLTVLRNPTEPSRWLLPPKSAQVWVVDVPYSPFSVQQQWIILRTLKRVAADVFHSPYYVMPLRPGVPTLLTVYDFIALRYPQYATLKTRMLYRLMHWLALRATTQTTTISAATAADLATFFPNRAPKNTVIPLAADPAFQPASVEDMAQVQTKYQLPDTFALYIGSNKPHKNLTRLVQAWHDASPPVPLVIGGPWDTRFPHAKVLAKTLDMGEQTRFLGEISEADLPALYNAAQFFIFPSEYEGFGLPILEAMACGTPVACAETSSLQEVAGNAAIFFNPADEAAIATAVTTLSHDTARRESLSSLGLARAQEFSWERTALETLKLYRTLA